MSKYILCLSHSTLPPRVELRRQRISRRLLTFGSLLYSFFPPRLCFMRPDTLGAEKKSGVPYILTSTVGIAKRPWQNMTRRHATWSIPRSATFVLRFVIENFGDFTVSVIRCCVRWRMLPPALGGLRFRVPPAPGPSCTREYGKDQVVMRSPARHENYTTPRF